MKHTSQNSCACPRSVIKCRPQAMHSPMTLAGRVRASDRSVVCWERNHEPSEAAPEFSGRAVPRSRCSHRRSGRAGRGTAPDGAILGSLGRVRRAPGRVGGALDRPCALRRRRGRGDRCRRVPHRGARPPGRAHRQGHGAKGDGTAHRRLAGLRGGRHRQRLGPHRLRPYRMPYLSHADAEAFASARAAGCAHASAADTHAYTHAYAHARSHADEHTDANAGTNADTAPSRSLRPLRLQRQRHGRPERGQPGHGRPFQRHLAQKRPPSRHRLLSCRTAGDAHSHSDPRGHADSGPGGYADAGVHNYAGTGHHTDAAR